MSKPIPIARAKEIAEEYGYGMVIILAVYNKENRSCVTTYGKTKELCKVVGQKAREIIKFLKWDILNG